MNLNFKKQYFILSDIFQITIAPSEDIGNLEEGPVPFIGRTNINNGLQGYVSSNKINKKKCITISMVGTNVALWQEKNFIASQNVAILRNANLSRLSALYICSILNFEIKNKFSYGRTISKELLNKMEILLPTNSENEPYWQLMEDYIKSINHKPITTKNIRGCELTLEKINWQEYQLSSLFEIKKGKRLTYDEQTEGNTPYIGAIDSNNGLSNRIGQQPIHKGNTISLSYNGSVGEAFYQPNDFWATDDVNVLYFKDKHRSFDKYIAIFICSILGKEKYRFSYGRKWTLENMKSTIIKLPTKNNQPDWDYMENYIKSLPYGDRI